MRISDWSSDVCSCDLAMAPTIIRITRVGMATWWRRRAGFAIGRGEGGAAGLVQPRLKDPALLPQAGEGLLSFYRREMSLPGGSGSRRPYLPGGGPSFIDRSIACPCLVSAPIEIQSPPSSAIARSRGTSAPAETSRGNLQDREMAGGGKEFSV